MVRMSNNYTTYDENGTKVIMVNTLKQIAENVFSTTFRDCLFIIHPKYSANCFLENQLRERTFKS